MIDSNQIKDYSGVYNTSGTNLIVNSSLLDSNSYYPCFNSFFGESCWEQTSLFNSSDLLFSESSNNSFYKLGDSSLNSFNNSLGCDFEIGFYLLNNSNGKYFGQKNNFVLQKKIVDVHCFVAGLYVRYLSDESFNYNFRLNLINNSSYYSSSYYSNLIYKFGQDYDYSLNSNNLINFGVTSGVKYKRSDYVYNLVGFGDSSSAVIDDLGNFMQFDLNLSGYKAAQLSSVEISLSTFGIESISNVAYESGYSQGVDDSQSTLNAINLIGSAFNSMGQLLDTPLMPGLSLGGLLSIPLVVVILMFILKILKGGS